MVQSISSDDSAASVVPDKPVAMYVESSGSNPAESSNCRAICSAAAPRATTPTRVPLSAAIAHSQSPSAQSISPKLFDTTMSKKWVSTIWANMTTSKSALRIPNMLSGVFNAISTCFDTNAAACAGPEWHATNSMSVPRSERNPC